VAKPARRRRYAVRVVREVTPPAPVTEDRPKRAVRRWVALAVIAYCALAWAAMFQVVKFSIAAARHGEAHYAQSGLKD